jgi:hypothetical protein
MTIDLFFTLLIVFVVVLIIFKVLRTVLTIAICILILYFMYFNFFTWDGAVKLATFIETLNRTAYKVEMKEITKEGKRIDYQIEPTISSKNGEETVEFVTCKSYGPVILCEAQD